MSFISDKKQEHEVQSEKAVTARDYAKAFFHAAKAAEFGFALAEQNEGKIAQSWLDNANSLLDIAEQFKEKARKQQDARPKAAVIKDGSGDDGKDSPEKSAFALADRPTERLDDVAGLADVKAELRDKVITPFLHPEVYEKFKVKIGGGILMYGPPGNGKTFVAKAIAGELDAVFFNVNTSQIKDKYVGETEKNIKRLFEEARKEPKAVIFLDEVDALLHKRGGQKVNAVQEFLVQMDGLVKNSNCLLLLAATNKPWALDEAVVRPGRLGTHIYVGPPDAAARAAMCAYNLKEVPLADGLSFHGAVEKTVGYSGADLAEVCNRAKLTALKRQLAGDEASVVSVEDMDAAVDSVVPSVSDDLLGQYDIWRKERQGAGGEDGGD